MSATGAMKIEISPEIVPLSDDVLGEKMNQKVATPKQLSISDVNTA